MLYGSEVLLYILTNSRENFLKILKMMLYCCTIYSPKQCQYNETLKLLIEFGEFKKISSPLIYIFTFYSDYCRWNEENDDYLIELMDHMDDINLQYKLEYIRLGEDINDIHEIYDFTLKKEQKESSLLTHSKILSYKKVKNELKMKVKSKKLKQIVGI